ncbi:MAG: suppressor of fused domain protein [Caulobacter sp.]|nr:suppressor of fused domain protein [Caulobacter sp.]
MTERAPVTAENREIGRVAAEIFGGEQNVHTWWDPDRRHNVDILSCVGSPEPDVTAYVTLTLSNHPLPSMTDDLRVELMGSCDSAVDRFPEVMASCAFNIIENAPVIGPGVVFPGAISFHGLSSTMEHALFLPPFLTDASRQTLVLPTRTVAWLRLLPISEAEFQHVAAHGFMSLLDVMNVARPNVYDINRASVL